MTESYSGAGRPIDPLESPLTESETAFPATGSTYADPNPAYTDTAYADAGQGTAASSGSTGSSAGSSDTTQTVKNEASDVASTAREAASRVAHSEKDMLKDTASEALGQARETAGQAKSQAKDLFSQGRAELNQGASDQLQRLSGGASSLSTELSSMADSSTEQGLASELARQASGYLHDASRWLENREAGDVLADVTSYARRHPGTFLAIAAGLGLVAGRVARSLKDESSEARETATTATGKSTLAGYEPGDVPPAAPGYGSATGVGTGYAAPSQTIPLTDASTTTGTAYGTPSGGYAQPGGELR